MTKIEIRQRIDEKVAEYRKHYQNLADTTEATNQSENNEMISNFMLLRQSQVVDTLNVKNTHIQYCENQNVAIPEKIVEEVFNLQCERIALGMVAQEYNRIFLPVKIESGEEKSEEDKAADLVLN